MTELQDRPSRGELAILEYLADHGGVCTVGEIADAVGTSKEVVSYHLYRKADTEGVERWSLMQRGLVSCVPHQSWAEYRRNLRSRSFAFSITKKGLKVVKS